MLENIPLQSNEEIAPIQGYEGLYSITSFGRVWSHRKIRKFGNSWGILKLSVSKKGYLCVNLYKERKIKKCKIQRIVALVFIPNPLNLPEVNHKDTNKQNNHKDNLEWCTSQGNKNHALIMGLRHKKYSKYYGVTYNKDLTHKNKPWHVQITINKKQKGIGYYEIELEAAQVYNNFVVKNNLNRPLNKI